MTLVGQIPDWFMSMAWRESSGDNTVTASMARALDLGDDQRTVFITPELEGDERRHHQGLPNSLEVQHVTRMAIENFCLSRIESVVRPPPGPPARPPWTPPNPVLRVTTPDPGTRRGREALDPQDIVVTSVGAVCPVGLDALAATAALRAGVSRLADAPEVSVPAGARGLAAEPALAARVSTVPASVVGPRRDLALLAPALSEALARVDLPPDRVVVCVGSGRDPEGLAAAIREWVGDAAAVEVTAGPRVQTAALHALSQAVAAVRRQPTLRVVVAAVGSRAEPETMRALARAGRLKSSLRPDGVVPGEAAAAVVVESAGSARQRGAPVLARVASSGSAAEPAPKLERAEGLTDAVRQAVSACDVGLVVADLNGERGRAREWALASMRALPFRPDERPVWHPAQGVGDAGVGAGALLLVVAALALARGHAGAEAALVVASDDDGARSAVVLAPVDRIAVVPGEPPLAWVAR